MADLLYKDKITNVAKPNKTSNLMSSSDLASKYGITYDAKAIEDKFNEATKAEYDVLRKEYEATQNKFYNNMYNNQLNLNFYPRYLLLHLNIFLLKPFQQPCLHLDLKGQ